ncbi:GNAT family N-acetyltransferase [Sorangium sp. So ce448]|uniref:GNAT family N-acetyltransferase n=1 Tax=Sorangium atrum TaxID=2995308 RepID=A0ABT5BQR5_9BACT|nr:GNAT family N-acetyltransferase [Sorangium aterium]MDC0676511.1 GNAT family N-acetyltransferase [Sorangium aterium]
MELEAHVHDTIRDIPESEWNALHGVSEAPFLTWAWFDALERTGCVGEEAGWLPHHITLRAEGALLAAAPAYLKDNSEGEFVFDHGWASASHQIGAPYYPKLVVAVPFTPATTPRLLVRRPEDRPALLPVLAETLRKLVARSRISSAHVLFPTEDEAAALSDAAMAHRCGVQFQFENEGYQTLDDFLARFNAKRRHQIRREMRESTRQGLSIDTLRGAEITPEIVDAMFGFYVSTVEKFAWGRQYLNRAFFEEITARLRGGGAQGGVEIVLAREGKRPIAGALNLAGPTTLYGRYWGASEERPFLHFNVCYYHPVEDCIARGLRRFEPGAGGSHKLVRGFAPSVTHSAHHIAHPRLDAAVREFLARERAAVRAKTADRSVAFR